MFRDFYDDPFFGFSDHSHRGRMLNDLEKKKKVRHHHRQSIEAPHHESNQDILPFMDEAGSLFSSRNPFSMFDSLMPDLGSLRNGLESLNIDGGQHGFGYSSMKVSSYVNDGSGQPQVFEAVQSTKVAPGGLKETKKALRDTKVGVEKMSLGRHIRDRGHVITREKNTKTGSMNENQDYIGFAEEEAGRFDDEWMRETRKYSGLLRSEKGKKYLKNYRPAIE